MIMFMNLIGEFFCDSEIGKHLAAVEGMRLITGGFFGIGELVSDSYSNERAKLNLPNNTWHVLPIRDSQVWTNMHAIISYN